MRLDGVDRLSFSRSDLEQVLYDHFLDRVQRDSTETLLEDFQRLFVEGRHYHNPQVYRALEQLTQGKEAQQAFNYCFNRCCYILINRWQMSSQQQSAIPTLVDLLSNLPPIRQNANYPTTSSRIRSLIRNFAESEHYLKLQRLARLINNKKNNRSVGVLIDRYPYLYNYCLLSEDSSREHQRTVRKIKKQIETNFEIKLSRYLTYQLRLAQEKRQSTTQIITPSTKIIEPVANPTLLTDKELNRSIKHFMGPVEGGYSYKSLSHNFAAQTLYAPNFQAFKDELYEYLSSSIDFGQGKFNKKLYETIKNTLPECNHQKPNEFLMLRTSSQLLNYLIVDNNQNLEHYVFIDLISNMGVTRTVGLLMKLTLICQKIKPYLEKRFSILFSHYENSSQEGVPWLVRSLENLQIAFSVNFGKVKLSGLAK